MFKKPLIPVTIRSPQTGNEKTVLGLVDTGADISLIPASLAHELGIPITGQTSAAILSGGIIWLDQYLVTMEICGSTTEQLQVASFKDSRGNGTVILGRDILDTDIGVDIFRETILSDATGLIKLAPAMKKKTVLILGPDVKLIDRMRTIKRTVDSLGYAGVLVKDVNDIEHQSVEEKVIMLGSLSRFIIFENSESSGHIDELKIASANRFVSVIVQERGKGATWMQADYPIDYAFMRSFEYENESEIRAAVTLAVDWAERKVAERTTLFNRLYPWRSSKP